MPSTLVAQTGRTTGTRATNRLRASGRIPGVLYGKGVDPTPISVDAREFRTAMRSGDHGLNTVLTLNVDGAEHLALAREIQRHTVRAVVTHVDFVVVDRDEIVAADVPIVLVGEADLGSDAMVDLLLSTLAIKAKPQTIPASIEIDRATLHVGSHVTVADLPLPAGVTTEVDGEEIVLRVTVADASAELEAAEAEASGVEPGTDDAGGEGSEEA